MAKIIGIIGGMGPAATLDLLGKIYANSPAESDQDHIRVLVDIDPTIPDRTGAIMSNSGEAVVAHLIKNAQGLIDQGAELLAMSCNTAHAFIRELEQKLTIPFVSIVDVTVAHLLDLSAECVGLLATDGTLAARLYAQELKAGGVRVIVPKANNQADLMRAIYSFKGGETKISSELALGVYNKLRTAGCKRIIAACTELPILLAGQDIVDPTELLARELVRQAG